MARERHRRTNSSKSERVSHEQKLRELSRKGVPVDPTNRADTSRAYTKYVKQRVPPHLERATSPEKRAELKRHGFRVTDKGVIVDGPRDKRRQPIKGSRLQVLSGGVIKTSVKQRRDFIYGFTKSEKKDFAKNPDLFIQRKLSELRKKIPSLARARKPQVRLQWGAYQAQKDFSPNYFTARYFATVSPEETRKVGKKKARPRADKLTGLHIVVHVPKKKAQKRGKKKGKKGRKKK